MTSLKFILVVFSLNLLAHAEKESLENLDQLLDDPAIWQYIEKRVQQDQKTQDHQSIDDESLSPRSHFPYGDEDNQISHSSDAKDVPENPPFQETRHEKFPYFRDESKTDKFPHYLHKTISDSSGNSCSYRQNSSLIIRSKTSLENGAAFLRNANHLSAEECARKCCYTQNCNLAVYEDKDEHSCYLFDCGSPSKCVFAPHANYTLLSFHETNNRLNEGGQSGHHENELENLGKTPQPQTTTTSTPAPKMAQVALYGECDIDWRQNCADQNAECRDSQCKCKDGYHAIYAYCRRLCDSDEFQCKNKGLDNKVPDCIDRKHWCDGVPQCADGSDEESCPEMSKDHKDESAVKDENDQINLKTPSPLPPAVPKEDETHDESDQEKHSETENVINLQNENVDKQSEDVKPTVAVTKSTSPVTSTPKAPVPKTTLKHVDLEAPEKVVIESPTDSNQGPIVALALGLGICLMLLIFVGCRLRTVKRRIRRGKSLHSNEADYLINGMYL